jgi:hypothetical protein
MENRNAKSRPGGIDHATSRCAENQKVLLPHPSRIQLIELPGEAKPLEDKLSTGFQDRHGYILSQ